MPRRYLAPALLAAFGLLAAPLHAATGTPPTKGSTTAPARRAPAPAPSRAAKAKAATPVPPAAPAAAPEAAPRTVCLAGTIVGANGQPRPGVCVFPTATPRLIAVSDAAGTFRLRVPATAGPLRMQADYLGLGSQRIEVDGQNPQPVRIVLGQ